MNRAGSADTDAAAELAAGQTQFVAKHPERRLPGISVITHTLAVYPEFHRLHWRSVSEFVDRAAYLLFNWPVRRRRPNDRWF
jgi:hypothetical protein